MKKLTSLLVGCSAAIIAISIVAYIAFPTQRDWHIARWKNSIEAYTSFLREHPESEYTSLANETLDQLRQTTAWRSVAGAPAPANLAKYLSEFPSASNLQEAQSLLWSALVKRVAEQYLKDSVPEKPPKTVEEIVKATLAARRDRPTSLDEYQRALVILSSVVQQPEAEPIRIAFPDILPNNSDEKDQWLAGARILPGSLDSKVPGMRVSGVREPTVEKVERVLVPAGKEGLDAVFVIRGLWPIDIVPYNPVFSTLKLSSRTKDFRANMAFDGRDAFTELPFERIYVTPFLFGGVAMDGQGRLAMRSGDVGVHIPFAHGSILRIRREVNDLDSNYKFKGDYDYPLAFVLLKQIGLTYLSGKGEVVRDMAKTWKFPIEQPLVEGKSKSVSSSAKASSENPEASSAGK